MNYEYDADDLSDDAARAIAQYVNRLVKDELLSLADGEIKKAVRSAIDFARMAEKESV